MRKSLTMQRRHFELIAKTIKELRDGMVGIDVDFVAVRFLAALKNTNPGFKRDTFLDACGVGAGGIEKSLPGTKQCVVHVDEKESEMAAAIKRAFEE